LLSATETKPGSKISINMPAKIEKINCTKKVTEKAEKIFMNFPETSLPLNAKKSTKSKSEEIIQKSPSFTAVITKSSGLKEDKNNLRASVMSKGSKKKIMPKPIFLLLYCFATIFFKPNILNHYTKHKGSI